MFRFEIKIAAYKQHWGIETEREGGVTTAILLDGVARNVSSGDNLLINGVPKIELPTTVRITQAESVDIRNHIYDLAVARDGVNSLATSRVAEMVQSVGTVDFLPAFEDKEMGYKWDDSLHFGLKAESSFFDALIRWTGAPGTKFEYFGVTCHYSPHVVFVPGTYHDYNWTARGSTFEKDRTSLGVKAFSFTASPPGVAGL